MKRRRLIGQRIKSSRIDMTGERIGRLTVVRVAKAQYGESSHTRWRCKCDCGRWATIVGNHLRKGRASQCQHCTTVARRKLDYDEVKRLLLSGVKHAAIAKRFRVKVGAVYAAAHKLGFRKRWELA